MASAVMAATVFIGSPPATADWYTACASAKIRAFSGVQRILNDIVNRHLSAVSRK